WFNRQTTLVSLSFTLAKKAIRMIMPTIKRGLKMVITIKERFLTLAKYSRLMIKPSLLSMVLVCNGLDENIIVRGHSLLKMVHIGHFGEFHKQLGGICIGQLRLEVQLARNRVQGGVQEVEL